MQNLRQWGWRLLIVGLIGLALVVGIKMIFGGEDKQQPPSKEAAAAKEGATPWDLSQRREEFISEERVLPMGKPVIVTFPCYRVKGGAMWYQISTSPQVKVEYDLLDGSAPKVESPGGNLVVERWPVVITIRAIEKAGKMRLTLNRQFTPDSSPVAKQVSFFGDKPRGKQKQQKPARKVLPDPDIPTEPQCL